MDIAQQKLIGYQKSDSDAGTVMRAVVEVTWVDGSQIWDIYENNICIDALTSRPPLDIEVEEKTDE